jgi:hypothetical protein
MAANYDDSGESTTTASGNTVNLPIPREVVEREVLAELAALRDEQLLRSLPEEVRCRLGDNPAGRVVWLSTEEFAKVGSVTNGVGCHGTTAFSHGVTCKILKIPAPKPTPQPQ